MGERVTVEGTVENVIFHNEENGYTVLLLTVEGEEEPVTVVGCIPCAAAGEGMTVTSAMKGLAPTVKAILGELILKDNWAQYAGQINTLGLVSGTDVEANYVQIPYESTQWSDTFTKDDYAALVAAMFDGTVTVSNDTETEPTVQTITVDYQGNIK